MKSLIVNCETGEETFVELTAAEIAEVEAREAALMTDQQKIPTIAEKLASVGLSIDELKAALSD